MKTIEELEAAWHAAGAARAAATTVLHERQRAAEVAFAAWKTAAQDSSAAFAVYRDAMLAEDAAFEVLMDARDAACAATKGDA